MEERLGMERSFLIYYSYSNFLPNCYGIVSLEMLILPVSLKLFSINNSVQDDVKMRFSLGSLYMKDCSEVKS
jgi:hypothetical protein